MDCIVGVACGLDVPAPDYDGGEGADELQDAEGIVGDEEGDTAGAVGAVVCGFFDHFCSKTRGSPREGEDRSEVPGR